MQSEKPIKLLIDQLMKDYDLTDKMAEQRVIHNWGDIVGTMISQHTSSVQITGNHLYVNVNSATLKSELQYHRSVMMGKVNNFIGKDLIKSITIR